MSLQKEGGTFIAQCDFCPNYIDTEEVEFMSAVDRIKSKGWKVFKKALEWFHKCDECLAAEDIDDFSEES